MKFNVKLYFGLSVVLLLSLLLLFNLEEKVTFDFFTIDCELFSANKKLIYVRDGFALCDFASNGNLLAASPKDRNISLFDKNDRLLWTATEHVHGQIKFINDENNFLVLYRVPTQFNNENVYDDCVSVRSLDNQKLKHWCVGENLLELRKFGIEISKPAVTNFSELVNGEVYNKHLSHMNSVYEIPQNKLSEVNSVFAKGNYLLNLHMPSNAIVVLDSEMKNILWGIRLTEINLNDKLMALFAHDAQITREGNLLLFVNFMVGAPTDELYLNLYNGLINGNSLEKFFNMRKKLGTPSRLVELNPLTKEIVWMCGERSLNKFDNLFEGAVNYLEDGNYLYSDNTTIGLAYVINRQCEKLWSFENPILNKKGKPSRFAQIRPLKSLKFLDARKIN